MSKHTPGPWIVGVSYDKGWPVFRLSQLGSTLSGPGTEVDANANLIAAAPDLLAACELALVRIDPDSARERNGKRPKDAAVLEGWAKDACVALRAAIAKARTP